jgi:hypothetical protein
MFGKRRVKTARFRSSAFAIRHTEAAVYTERNLESKKNKRCVECDRKTRNRGGGVD